MMRSFFQELKRRKVFNVAIVYGVVSWVLIQVADVGAPALLLPDWFVSFVTFCLFLGFPIAMVLAWAYDLTPHGIESTPSLSVLRESRDEPKAVQAIAQVPPAPAQELAAVAVIPFDNLTPASEYAFLADAIAMELHSSLSRVHQLRVASRHSSFAKGEADKDVSTIARDLGVQYVITGNVAHIGSKIRVIAEVDDAERDTLLWSESYDVDVDEILSVQQEIVESIVSAFGGERLRADIAKAKEAISTNLDAWGLVQRARGYLLDYSPDSVAQAVDMLQDAVRLDPDYAVAQASLGLLLAERIINGISDDVDKDRADANAAIGHAEANAPQDPIVLRTAGCVLAYNGDYEKSESLLRRAVRIAPLDLGAWGYLGWPLAAKGDVDSLEELHGILDRLLKTAPRHPGQAYWLFHKSVAYTIDREYDEALECITDSTGAQPRFALGWMHKANVLGHQDQSQEASAAADQCMRISASVTPEYYAKLMSVFSDQRHVIEQRTNGLRAAGLLPRD
jgi:adenylate cyclase